MLYSDALDYLYGFINTKLPRQARYQARAVTLDRVQTLMAQIGNPHQHYPMVHITGTKGKGSVGAMVAAVLEAAGFRVGLYSSPHLQDFRERIRINQTLISPDELIYHVERLQPHLEANPNLTWFEVVTALAFDYFHQQAVEIAVIEVGLGGRLDATNIINPLVSVITSLSYDHTSILGETLTQIATEKAGIIKPQTPVISAPQPPEALEVLQRTADEQNAPLIVVGQDWDFEPLTGDLHHENWLAAPQGQPLRPYQSVLIGQHQVINGTVALATLCQLRQQGWQISQRHIKSGLMQVNWSGRLEIVRTEPMVVLDAAHNAASADWLAQTLRERFLWRPLILVFAAKSDKDIGGMLNALLPITDHLVITQAVDSRAESPEAIAELARSKGYINPLQIIPDVPTALQLGETLAGKTGLMCATGSLYLVGEARTVYDLAVGQAFQWNEYEVF